MLAWSSQLYMRASSRCSVWVSASQGRSEGLTTVTCSGSIACLCAGTVCCSSQFSVRQCCWAHDTVLNQAAASGTVCSGLSSAPECYTTISAWVLHVASPVRMPPHVPPLSNFWNADVLCKMHNFQMLCPSCCRCDAVSSSYQYDQATYIMSAADNAWLVALGLVVLCLVQPHHCACHDAEH